MSAPERKMATISLTDSPSRMSSAIFVYYFSKGKHVSVMNAVFMYTYLKSVDGLLG